MGIQLSKYPKHVEPISGFERNSIMDLDPWISVLELDPCICQPEIQVQDGYIHMLEAYIGFKGLHSFSLFILIVYVALIKYNLIFPF